MRILQGKAADNAVMKLASRSSQLQKAEPRVRQIVRAVRRGGDRTLIRYATLWDGLQPGQPIRVSA